MIEKLTWKEKRDLLIVCPYLSVKQIQLVFDIGQPSALELRAATLKQAKKDGRWVGDRKVPTDLALKAYGVDMSYFEVMAEKEKRFAAEKGKDET